jgi:hypothetical protein
MGNIGIREEQTYLEKWRRIKVNLNNSIVIDLRVFEHCNLGI